MTGQITNHIIGTDGKRSLCNAPADAYNSGVLFPANSNCPQCLALAKVKAEDMPRRHVPEIAARKDGSWGVFCGECSAVADEYVYPCLVGTWKQAPPEVLYVTPPRGDEDSHD